ncbi:MAG: hypothetical protein ACHQRM_00490 [Bacteroidia bacterium]
MKYSALFILVLLSSVVAGQNKTRLEKDFTPEDSTALATMAAYPDSTRLRILQICLQPEILVRTESLQKSASEQFRETISNYSKDEQKKFWDLSRHPGLLTEITGGGKKTKEELEAIAARYPHESKSDIVELGRKDYDLLSQINTLQISTQQEYEKITGEAPEPSRSAFRRLVLQPDVLNTLSANMHMTVVLGTLYASNARQTAQMLDRMHADEEKQNASNLEDWKKGLEQNPEAKKEMEQAAREFAKEKDGENDNYPDDIYETGSGTRVYDTPPAINYIVEPYPYWFGYPWWYDYPYWYPYPYWYQCGFYWGPGGIVYLGFPSPFFMHWYLYHPYHHYYYSHFSDYCIGYHHDHYYGPRSQRSGFNSEIHRWTRANEPNLPSGYFNPDASRAARVKELGKFEMNYHNSTKGVFGRNITRSEFLQHNASSYPRMKPAITQPRFNQPIHYPSQQNTPRFNMGRPGGTLPVRPSYTPGRSGGGGGHAPAHGGGVRKRTTEENKL